MKMDEKSLAHIYEAKQRWSWRVFNKFLKKGINVNLRLNIKGRARGYRPLHFAAMEGNEIMVRILIEEHKANVNCVGYDGMQPIHLACLYRHLTVAEILLKSGADVDAKFTEKMLNKYNADEKPKWSNDFGDIMTLLTFAIINNYSGLTELLIRFKADVGIKSANKKTLLMYAFENHHDDSVMKLIDRMKNNSELINAKDNEGLHAVHYLLPDREFEEFRYADNGFFDSWESKLVKKLILAEADVNAMINNNPDTQILNRVAYRCCFLTLNVLLDIDAPYSAKARPLHYFMLPVDPKKYARGYSRLETVEHRRNQCLDTILKNLILRQALEMFVSEEEVDLMGQLIAVDSRVEKIVKNFKEEFINGDWKNFTVFDGAKSLTIYDLAKQVFDDKKLKKLVKNVELVKAYQTFYNCKKFRNVPMNDLLKKIDSKIRKASETCKLFGKVQEIPILRKFIPFPYEITLMILENLNNDNLRNFIQAFYQRPISF